MTAHDTLEMLVRQDLNAAEASAVVAAAAQAGVRFGWYADLLRRTGFEAGPELSRVPILWETDPGT